MFLEKQLHRVDGSVSASEKQLAADGPLSAAPGALQDRSKQLQVTSSQRANHHVNSTYDKKILNNNKQ